MDRKLHLPRYDYLTGKKNMTTRETVVGYSLIIGFFLAVIFVAYLLGQWIGPR